MIRPKIRVAQNSDAEVIQQILKANDMFTEGLDWSRLYPNWLIAEWKRKPIGCVQFLIGYPVGMIPMLAVLPGYRDSGTGMYLMWAAEELLRQAGCDGFLGITDSGRVLKKLPKLGGLEIGEFTLFVKRIFRDIKKEEVING